MPTFRELVHRYRVLVLLNVLQRALLRALASISRIQRQEHESRKPVHAKLWTDVRLLGRRKRLDMPTAAVIVVLAVEMRVKCTRTTACAVQRADAVSVVIRVKFIKQLHYSPLG